MPHEHETFVLANCAVWTAGGYLPAPAAVGIAGGHVAAVGGIKEVTKRVAAREIDLGGRLVVPGFIDSHVHILSGGQHLTGLDLRGAGGREEFVDRIRRDVERTPAGQWVTGGRWDNSRWPGAPLPHKEWIDGFSAGTPVWVTRADGHIGLANSSALAVAGITRNTDDPPGGRMDRDVSGEPTGILRDGAIALVRDRIPEPTEDRKAALLKAACNHAVSLGVTGLSDMDSRGVLPVLKRLEAAGELPCRIVHWMGIDRWREAAELKRSGEFDAGLVRIAGVKAFVDGSLGARTAWMFEPYDDEPSNVGLAMDGVEEGRLEADLRSALAAGLDAAVHAIGDRANSFALNLFERLRRDGAAEGRVLRIEHAQHLRGADIPRFRNAGVVASVQPAHVPLDGPLVLKALGPDRTGLTYAFASLAASGAEIAFGTDWPVVDLDPMTTLRAAGTREGFPRPTSREGIRDEGLGLEEALRFSTLGAARALRIHDEAGETRPGMSADLAVLSSNVFEKGPEVLREAHVEMTVSSGRIVYSK